MATSDSQLSYHVSYSSCNIVAVSAVVAASVWQHLCTLNTIIAVCVFDETRTSLRYNLTYSLSPSAIGACYGYILSLPFCTPQQQKAHQAHVVVAYCARLDRGANIPTLPASDWTIVRIYPRFLHPIGPR
eukprot:1176788-Prorocentrum_minimum.AAC.3